MTLSTRTLMFTDIEGSTALLERAGARYPDLLARHRPLVRGAIARHGGEERGTEGDSFFVTFDSASSALAAAVDAQRAVELEPWPDGQRIRIRMGLHIGEVLDHDNDLVGMAIHHAARIAATAHGGQVVLSDSVRDMSPALPADVELRSLGVHRLRDIGAIEVFQVAHPDLQAAFPPLRGVVQPRTNLPLPRTALVGGDAVLAAMAEQLVHGSLLTLTGSGGVGKTRLAVEYARRHLDEFESGAVLVDLAAIAGEGAVPGAIATALSVFAGSTGEPLALLVDWVADRELLLVVDNCEHLLAEVGDTVDALTSGCPRLRVLATSREALGVPGERVLRVPSLDPVTDATDLFLQRARAADTSFAVDGHRDTVVQICTRLDGIPLAIELAAARVRSLSPPDLLARLEDRFRLLRGSGRGTLDRHQTLRAMVSWSYQLLQPDEQALFDRLSVFAGGFDLRAAEAVCGFEPIDEMDVLDLLGSLVDKSMVVATHGPTGTRFRLLETMRQFGEERLEGTPDLADVRRRHLRHFVQVADELWTVVTGPDQVDGARRTAEEWDNLRAAHLWALAEQELPTAEFLVRSTYDFAELRFRHEHGAMAQHTAELADALGTPSTLMLGLWAQWSDMQGDLDAAVRLARRGLDVALAQDHPSTVFCWNNALGEPSAPDESEPLRAVTLANMRRAVAAEPDQVRHWVEWVDLMDTVMVLDPDAAPALLEDIVALADRVRSPRLMFSVLQFRAGLIVLDASPEAFAAAEVLYTQCYELARQSDDAQQTAMMLRSFALVAAGVGRADAPERCSEALEFLYDLRYWQKTWQVLDSAALALATVGRTEHAARIVGFLDGRGLGYGYEHVLGYRDRTKALLPDDSAHREALADGARLQPDDLVKATIAWCSPDEAAAA